MQETEGVIKYQLRYEFAEIRDVAGLDDLIAWRARLHRRGLLGQDPARYDGFGFGNVSLRTSGDRFVISGTQTGLPEVLSANRFVEVLAADPAANVVHARGPVKPSSEALTHAAVYQLGDDIRCVLHVHSPEIWRHAESLRLPCVAADIGYGSAQMAEAVLALYPECQHNNTGGLFVMLGHIDGVVAFGVDPESAGTLLMDSLARIERDT